MKIIVSGTGVPFSIRVSNLLQPGLVQIEELQLLQGLFTVVTGAKYRSNRSSSMSRADCTQKCQTRGSDAEPTRTRSLCYARGKRILLRSMKLL